MKEDDGVVEHKSMAFNNVLGDVAGVCEER